MLKIKKINNFNLTDKKVLVRLDLNIPFIKGKVLDDTRIKSAIPTIKEIIKKKGIPIVISHFGRPKGKRNKKFSLKKIINPLSKILRTKILFCNQCIGLDVKKILKKVKPKQIVLLENLRFHNEELKNDLKFAKKLSEYCDIYINDAFSVSHRLHSSVNKITQCLPSGIGKNMEKEIINLNKFLKKPKKPFTAIVGGAKMQNKINLINALIKKCDYLILGGGVANTFLKSNNINIGKSIFEKKQIKNALAIQKKALIYKCKIILPVDAAISKKKRSVNIYEINKNNNILDLGKKSVFQIINIINKSKTIIWSGPLGYFEKKPYNYATNEIANAINSKKKIISVVGGGDTIAALKKNKKIKNFSFLSTGGGAFLNWIEKLTLPGIEILKKN